MLELAPVIFFVGINHTPEAGRESVAMVLGQALDRKIRDLHPTVFGKEADDGLRIFSREVFGNIDLAYMVTYDRPRKPPVILQVYRKLVEGGFDFGQITFVMGLLESVLAEYVASVRKTPRIERAPALYPLEEAMIADTVLAQVVATRGGALAPKFAEVFGMSEAFLASALVKIREDLKVGDAGTVPRVMEDVRRQVAKHFSKKRAGTESELERFAEREIYAAIKGPEILALVRQFHPASFQLKEKPADMKGEFFHDQIGWIYAVFKATPAGNLTETKRSLARIFGCNFVKIDRLKYLFAKDKDALPERLHGLFTRFETALRRIRPKSKPEAGSKLEELTRAQLLRRVYEKISDEQARRLVKLLEPGENGFEIGELDGSKTRSVSFRPRITPEQRKWIFALFVAADNGGASTEQARVLARIFNCDVSIISVLSRVFGENGQRVVSAQVWRDFNDVKEFLAKGKASSARPVDSGVADWYGFATVSGVANGCGDRALAYGLDAGRLMDEFMAHAEMGVRVGGMVVGGVKQDEGAKSLQGSLFANLAGVPVNGTFEEFSERAGGEPARFVSLNLGGDLIQDPRLRDFFTNLKLTESAAVRIDFSGWSRAKAREFLIGDGPLVRLKPAEGTRNPLEAWRSLIFEAPKKLPLPFLAGAKPYDLAFMKFRVALGTVIYFIEREMAHVLTAHVDREHGRAVQKFLQSLSASMDFLNEICVRDFLGSKKLSRFSKFGDWQNEVLDSAGVLMALRGEDGGQERKTVTDFMAFVAADLARTCSTNSRGPKALLVDERGRELRQGDRNGGLKRTDKVAYSVRSLPYGLFTDVLRKTEGPSREDLFLQAF